MKEWNFPTGEYGVIVDDSNVIQWDWKKNKDVFSILSQINAKATKLPYQKIYLNVPYLPYSRQDKQFNIGESNSLALLISILGYSTCITDLVINTVGVHNFEATRFFCEKYGVEFNNDKWGISQVTKLPFDTPCNIVFPDKHAKDHFIINPTPRNIYYCSKVRGDKGEIISFNCDVIADISLPTFIMDDICDGGMTFIKCAESLKKQGMKDIKLFVYHGFFTKGLQPLLDAGINHIYTTSSVCDIQHEKLTILTKGN